MSSSSPIVRRWLAHEWPRYRELRLQALDESPDAFGSTFALESASLNWQARLETGAKSALDIPLVAEVDGAPIGLAWGKVSADTPQEANVYQMWVHPDFRGRGAGHLLLRAVLDWARTLGVRTVILRVTCGDTSARRLYERAGFVPFGAQEPIRQGANLLAQSMKVDLT
jgi:GNAT superfamily N-acetyltransferase